MYIYMLLHARQFLEQKNTMFSTQCGVDLLLSQKWVMNLSLVRNIFSNIHDAFAACARNILPEQQKTE